MKILLGDRFLLKDNKTIVEVFDLDVEHFSVVCIKYPITFLASTSMGRWIYNYEDLKFIGAYEQYDHLNIKCKLPSLKDKIDQL